ncbi:hypothetical protein JDV02_005535 [Purpureocillium takamizusanense]|uniref:Uncharacterized protein n=1 Tax=Purpureocillium takamizusanense TaxID=2060973 RepID=A0A9Q8QHM3_9HYPO|nr:uncharacterized protein JDV02_005535 [Purpureocillium takamizusanense]UNI19346.1 hypothetical protein JDV02_005535 [Purpureocillium takamizusanense]
MVRIAAGLAVAMAALSGTHTAAARSIASHNNNNTKASDDDDNNTTTITPLALHKPASNSTGVDPTGMQDVRDAIARTSAGGGNNKKKQGGPKGGAHDHNDDGDELMPGVDTRAGPVAAHGQLVDLPLRMDVRCRWNYVSENRDLKVYRAFMRPGRDMPAPPGDKWCDDVHKQLERRCGRELGGVGGKLTWHRCAGDSKDLLNWGRKGEVATWELAVEEGERPACAREALERAAGGWTVDWMGHEGCYQAYGFEIEY